MTVPLSLIKCFCQNIGLRAAPMKDRPRQCTAPGPVNRVGPKGFFLGEGWKQISGCGHCISLQLRTFLGRRPYRHSILSSFFLFTTYPVLMLQFSQRCSFLACRLQNGTILTIEGGTLLHCLVFPCNILAPGPTFTSTHLDFSSTAASLLLSYSHSPS